MSTPRRRGRDRRPARPRPVRSPRGSRRRPSAAGLPRSRSDDQPGDQRGRVEHEHAVLAVEHGHGALVGRRVPPVDRPGQGLELDRGLRLVAHPAPSPEEAGDGVEQPADAGRPRRRGTVGEIEHGARARRGRRRPAPARPERGRPLGRARPRPSATARGWRPRLPAWRPGRGGRPARSRTGPPAAPRRPTSCRPARSPARRRPGRPRARSGRARPCRPRRGRGGAGPRWWAGRARAASLVDRYSGWRSWATTSGTTPYRSQRWSSACRNERCVARCSRSPMWWLGTTTSPLATLTVLLSSAPTASTGRLGGEGQRQRFGRVAPRPSQHLQPAAARPGRQSRRSGCGSGGRA